MPRPVKKKWEDDLSGYEKRVTDLKTNLESYETGFNFVGLHRGFNELSESKNTERKDLLKWLRMLGTLVCVPLLLELFYIVLSSIFMTEPPKDIIYISLVPIVSLTALFVYYFRVVLHDYKSVKSQILQIELRKTLCQFIQSYTGYAKEMKEKDNMSLEKFENIIFSGIVSDDEKIPSTFDGVDQIGKLVKSVRN